ncbi:putative isxo2-like transposase domain protein [Nephila pilipes]|uniref:Putative isxo2-like transposase domain protein n=1 Tax=Nephila pilipes TaxID=299642 RepID=A0A8X6P4E9_NEPPI|nr:putative isxo2-like transposase domain protein [Nephila pilipes]
MTNMWELKANRVFIAFEVGESINSVKVWMDFSRKVRMGICVFESSMLGVPGEIVEIDESMFGERKFNRGRRVHGTWVFGGVQRGTYK